MTQVRKIKALTIAPAGKDAKRVLREGEIIGLVLRLANDRWAPYDLEERRIGKLSYEKTQHALAGFDSTMREGRRY